MYATIKPVTETHFSKVLNKVVTNMEQVLVYVDGYPMFLVHSDFIYDLDNGDVYNRLRDGETVEVEFSMRAVEE